MNDPAQILSLFLNGALGRSGRKRARRAASFITGHRGLITASGILSAAGIAWGIYDSLKAESAGVTRSAGVTGAAPPLPTGTVGPPPQTPPGIAGPASPIPPEVLRIIRLAISASRADGAITAPERTIILEHARRAVVEAEAEREIDRPHPLADIVRGVSDPQARQDLYVLAFTIVRADEAVSGGERIYLAQLAHQLGLDAETAARLATETAARIDAAGAQ